MRLARCTWSGGKNNGLARRASIAEAGDSLGSTPRREPAREGAEAKLDGPRSAINGSHFTSTFFII